MATAILLLLGLKLQQGDSSSIEVVRESES